MTTIDAFCWIVMFFFGYIVGEFRGIERLTVFVTPFFQAHWGLILGFLLGLSGFFNWLLRATIRLIARAIETIERVVEW